MNFPFQFGTLGTAALLLLLLTTLNAQGQKTLPFDAEELTAFDDPWALSFLPDAMIYQGDAFAQWQGNALVAGLSSQAIVRLELGDDSATEVARYPMKARIRSLEEGPDGAIWVLEDGGRSTGGGRLLKLTPR